MEGASQLSHQTVGAVQAGEMPRNDFLSASILRLSAVSTAWFRLNPSGQKIKPEIPSNHGKYSRRFVRSNNTFSWLERTEIMNVILASFGPIINHSWIARGPGGYYGFIEEQTGHGLLDAHTTVAFGPRIFEIPLPFFAIAILAISIVLLTLCIWHLVERIRRT
jgi:hypothetical protein